jgi:hypothetical protein
VPCPGGHPSRHPSSRPSHLPSSGRAPRQGVIPAEPPELRRPLSALDLTRDRYRGSPCGNRRRSRHPPCPRR